MDKYIIIVLALLCVVLAVDNLRQKAKYTRDYENLEAEIEAERILRTVERSITNIMIEDRDRRIDLLKEALRGSEAKRKELCTRLWEEEELK